MPIGRSTPRSINWRSRSGVTKDDSRIITKKRRHSGHKAHNLSSKADMDIIDLLAPEAVLPPQRPHNKKQLLHELAARAAEFTGLPERRILEILTERERLGSTGMGQGIAIPHGRLAGLPRIFGMFLRLESPIPYDAIDDQPVDLVFLLLSHEAAGAEHLK